MIGLYFISTESVNIPYPFKKSKLLYIGMSEKRTNSIGSRLTQHKNRQSGNTGLYNYSQKNQVKFTYLNFDSLKDFWKLSIEDLESYFILDFAKYYGAYPICNNKSGFPDLPKSYFELIGVFMNENNNSKSENSKPEPKTGNELISAFFQNLKETKDQYLSPELIEKIVSLYENNKLTNIGISNELRDLRNKKKDE